MFVHDNIDAPNHLTPFLGKTHYSIPLKGRVQILPFAFSNPGHSSFAPPTSMPAALTRYG